MKNLVFSLLLMFFISDFSVAQSYNGSYSLKTDEATITISFQEGSNGILNGTMESTTGVSYRIEGQIEGDVAMGTCYDDQSGMFFEAYLEGSTLTFGLIEPDEYNMPDYDNANYYTFEKVPGVNGGQAGNSMANSLGMQQQQGNNQTYQNQPQQQGYNQTYQNQSQQQGYNQTYQNQTQQQGYNQTYQNQSQQSGVSGTSTGNSTIGDKEAGDPMWGWKFIPPEGWSFQKDENGVYLGHNTIAGLIIVYPNESKDMQQLQQELVKGIDEDGSYLRLSGNIQSLGNNILTGEYTGVMEGKNVKARGIGTLSPYGGGTFIIAVTTTEKYGEEIRSAAAEIANRINYFKSSVSDMMRHFAGKWTNYTKNTSTWITLYPDGRYTEAYESSYSGSFSDGGSWGTGGQDSENGRWTVQGDTDYGKIICTLNNGNEVVYKYIVNDEYGQKIYTEYWFNNDLYQKSGIE